MANDLELVIRARNLTDEAFASLKKNVQELGGEVEKTGGGFTESAKGGLAFGAAAGIGAIAATKLAEAAAATYTALLDMVAGFVQAGSAISDLSLKTGLSTTALQEYAYAGSLVGTSSEAIATAVVRLGKSIEEGSVKTRTVINDLGLSIASLQQMKPEDQFKAIATAIKGLDSPGAQASATFALMGRSAEILKVIRSDFEGAAEDAQRFGFVLSEDAVRAADELGDSVTTLGATWEGFQNQIAQVIVKSTEANDVVRGMSIVLADVSKGGDGATSSFGKFVAGLGSFLAVAGPVTSALKLIADGFAAIAKEDLPSVAAATKTTFGEMGTAAIDFDAILAAGVRQSVQDVKDGEKAKTQARKDALAEGKAASKEMADAYKADIEAQVFATNYFERESKKAWDDLVVAVKSANEFIENDTVAAYNKMQQKVKDFAEQGIRKMREEQEKANEKTKEQIELYGKMGDVLGLTGQLFGALGLEGNKALSGLLDAGNAALAVFTNLASGNIWGAIMAGISGVISLIGVLRGLLGDFFDWLGGLFGGGSPYDEPIKPFPDVPNPKNPGGPGGGYEPQEGGGFAAGGWFPYQSGGYQVTVGEASNEAVLNEPQIQKLVAQAVAMAMVANGGSYQGGGNVVVPVYMDGREVTRVVSKGRRRRHGLREPV